MDKVWEYIQHLATATFCSLLTIWVLQLTGSYMTWMIASSLALALVTEYEN